MGARQAVADEGFTLVELLVAMAIFLVLSVILVSVSVSAFTLWQQGIAHRERRQAAMTLVGLLSRDLRNAALPSDLPGSTLQFVINRGTGFGPAFRTPQAVFWQAPSGTERSRGELAVVGYFVQWAAESPKAVPRLSRFFANASFPNPASTTGYLLEAGMSQPNTPWMTTPLLQGNAPATKDLNYLGMLEENVLGLWLQPLDQLGNAITKQADGTPYSAGEYDSRLGYLSSNGRKYLNALPASIEIAFVTVDSRTAQRLAGGEKPGSRTTHPNPIVSTLWNDVNAFYNNTSLLPVKIRQGAQIHSTIINLTGAPQ